MKKRLIACMMAAVLAFSMVGCSGSETETTAAASETAAGGVETEAPVDGNAKKQVNIEINGDPNTLAPYVSSSNPRNRTIVYNIYETLFFRFDFGGELTPCIAESYEHLDGLTYRIHLYDYVKDSAGNPIKADDVVFSYNKAIESGQLSTYVGSVEKIEKVDDFTVDLTLNSDQVSAFDDSVIFVPIVSQASWEASEDEMITTPVGSGPYVLDEWISGSSLSLVKNENYWQDPAVSGERQAVDKIVYKEVTEAAQITIELETGEVDFAYDVQSSDLFHFQDGGDVENYDTYSMLMSLIQCIFFNCSEKSPCNDVRVRQAIAYAIDSNAILNTVYGGDGEVATAFSNSLYADYQDSWKNADYYNYNLEKAKGLLADAGYANGLNLRIITNTNANHKRIAEIIMSMLGQIGITCEIFSYENALFNTYSVDENEFDIYVTQKAAGGRSVLIWKLNCLGTMYGGTTKNFLKDDQFQSLLETALSAETNSDETVEACWQRLKEQVPIYGLCTANQYFVHSDDMTPAISSETSVFYPGMSTYTAEWGRTVE